MNFKVSAISNSRLGVFIVSLFLMFAFQNCSNSFTVPSELIVDTSLVNTPHEIDPVLTTSACRVSQISGSTVNLGNAIQFQFVSSSDISLMEYTCDHGQTWSNFSMNGDEVKSLLNIPIGVYQCSFHGKNIQNQFISCEGLLNVSVVNPEPNSSGGFWSSSGSSPSSSSGSSSGISSSSSSSGGEISSSSSSSGIGGSTSTSSSSGGVPSSNSSGGSLANFFSLHQGTLTYPDQAPLVGFKNQNAVTGYTGCLIGYPEYRSLCPSVTGGFSLSFPGYTYNHEYKIFIPAGTKFFSLTGNHPQTVQYAVAVRLDQPPQRSTELSSTEYEMVKGTQDIEAAFGKILNGEELLLVHSGGGNMTMSGVLRMSSNPLAQGHWLYIRVLNGDGVYLLGAVYEVDKEKYRQGFNSLQFNSAGDPL